MRPFHGLPGEGDWVALREFVPAATVRVRLVGEHADRDVTVATVLPGVVPALTRDSGAVLIGVQAAVASTDPSRDLAAALMAALAAEPGTAIESIPAESIPTGGNGGRLQDLIDPAGPFDVAVHDGFDFWIEDADDPTGELAAALERANASVVPTQRLSAVDSAYWCAVRDRNHVRWVMPHAEAPLVDALARLHSAGESSLGDGTRLVGSFRAHGLVVPVWDLPSDLPADAVEEPAAAFVKRLADALAVAEPLTADERRAREGLRNRQLTLR